jgi:flagellar hook-length control protein FliK
LTILAANTKPTRDPSERTGTVALETLSLGRLEGASGTSLHPVAPVTTRTDLAAHVMRQIADVAQHMPARPVEITLNPEELGRVRLTVSTHEGGITLNILAERPETADLLRRHIGQLGQQFQSMGYESISFSFSGDSDAQTSRDQARKDARGDHAADRNNPPPVEITLATGPAAGLDLRL